MVKLLLILLASAIVMGASPISHHMSSMQTMHMGETTMSHQSNMDHGSMGEDPTGSCCDEIASFSVGCAFLIPQYGYIDFSGDSEPFLNTKPVVQPNYIETVTPPPKA
jgi:hypothetical protein